MINKRCNNNKGWVIPSILCVLLLIICHIFFSFWSMSVSRSRYENTLNSRKAYFMARSAVEHIELKIKTMQHFCYESILNLEKAPDDEKNFLFSVFMKDILVPFDNQISKEKLEYYIKELKILPNEKDTSSLTFEIKVTGVCGGYESSIRRLIKVSRE